MRDFQRRQQAGIVLKEFGVIAQVIRNRFLFQGRAVWLCLL